MSPTPEQRFATLAADLAKNTAAVLSDKKGFGSGALTIDGKIFALLSKERLVVKLSRRRVDELIAARCGERFDPGHGRLMKEWIAMDCDCATPWAELAREAMTFVGAKAPRGERRK
jgi:hypothetical protein